MSADLKYRAFISYSHRDEYWGRWLHRRLERFVIPRSFIPQDGQSQPARIYPVFRDKDELPTSSELSAAIDEALRASEFLIIICSPRSAASRWVEAEIRTFKQLGRSHRIIALIIDGEPNASDKTGHDPQSECFPQALRFDVDAEGELTAQPCEPVAADLRPGRGNRRDALLKVVAGLLGIGYDDLKQRDLRRRQRNAVLIAMAAVILTVAFAVISLFAVRAQLEAEQERDQAQIAQEREAQARSDAEASKRLAIASERSARIELANSLIAQAAAGVRSNDGSRGETALHQAINIFDDLAEPTTGAELGLYDLYARIIQPLLVRQVTDAPIELVRLYDATAVVADRRGSVFIVDLLSDTVTKVPLIWTATVMDIKRNHALGCYMIAGSEGDLTMYFEESGDLIELEIPSVVGHGIVRLSPDGRRVFVTQPNPFVPGGAVLGIWDPWTRKRIATGESLICHDAQFGQDSRSVVMAGHEGEVTLVGSKLRFRLGRHHHHAQSALCVARAALGGLTISGGRDGSVYLADAKLGNVWALVGHGRSVNSVAISADGRTGVSGSDDRKVFLWDLVGGTPTPTAAVHRAPVGAVCLSATGVRALSGDDQGRIAVWPIIRQEGWAPLSTTSEPIEAITAVRDLGAAVTRRGVRFWHLPTQLELGFEEMDTGSHAADLQFTPDATTLVVAGGTNDTIRWTKLDMTGVSDASEMINEGGERRLSHPDHGDGILISQVSIDPSCRTVLAFATNHYMFDGQAVGSRKPEHVVWCRIDTQTGVVAEGHRDSFPGILSVARTAGDDQILVGCRDGSVRRFDVANNDFTDWMATPFTNQDVSALACHPDSSTWFAGSSSGMMAIGSSADAIDLVRISDAPLTTMAMAHDATLLAIADRNRSLYVWSIAEGKVIHATQGLDWSISAIHPVDQRGFVTGSSETEVFVSENGAAILWKFNLGKDLPVMKDAVHDPHAGYPLASWLAFRGQWDWVHRLQESAKGTPHAKKAMLAAYLRQGSYDAAMSLIEANPGLSHASLFKRFVTGMLDAARDQDRIKQLLSAKPTLAATCATASLARGNQEARLLRGLAYFRMGLLSEAEEDFAKVLEAAPEDQIARSHRARLLLKLGRYREAGSELQKALEQDPEEWQLWLRHAAACSAQARDTEDEGLRAELVDAAFDSIAAAKKHSYFAIAIDELIDQDLYWNLWDDPRWPVVVGTDVGYPRK